MVFAYADGSWKLDSVAGAGTCGIGVVIYKDKRRLVGFGNSFEGVPNSQTAEALAVMRALKSRFDPGGVLNPGRFAGRL